MNLQEIKLNTADTISLIQTHADSVTSLAWGAARISGVVFKECGLYPKLPEWVPRKHMFPASMTSQGVAAVILGVGVGLQLLEKSGDTETAYALREYLSRHFHKKSLQDWEKINIYSYFNSILGSEYGTLYPRDISMKASECFHNGEGEAFADGFNTLFIPPKWEIEDKQALADRILLKSISKVMGRRLPIVLFQDRPRFEEDKGEDTKKYMNAALDYMESLNFSMSSIVQNMGSTGMLGASQKETALLAEIIFERSAQTKRKEERAGLFLHLFELKQHDLFLQYTKELSVPEDINQDTMQIIIEKYTGINARKNSSGIDNRKVLYSSLPDSTLSGEYISSESGELLKLGADFRASADLLKKLSGDKKLWLINNEYETAGHSEKAFSNALKEIYSFYSDIVSVRPDLEGECCECARGIIEKTAGEVFEIPPPWASYSAIQSVISKECAARGANPIQEQRLIQFIERVLIPVFGINKAAQADKSLGIPIKTQQGSPFFSDNTALHHAFPGATESVFRVASHFYTHPDKKMRAPNLLYSGRLIGSGLKDALSLIERQLGREISIKAISGEESKNPSEAARAAEGLFSALVSVSGVIPVLSSIVIQASSYKNGLPWFYPEQSNVNNHTKWAELNFNWDKIFGLDYGLQDIFEFLEKKLGEMEDETKTARERTIATFCAYDSLFCLLGFVNTKEKYTNDKAQEKTITKEELRERFPVLFRHPAIGKVHPLTGAPFIWTIDRLWGEDFRPLARELMNDPDGTEESRIYTSILGASYGFMPRDLSAKTLSQKLSQQAEDIYSFFLDTLVERSSSKGRAQWLEMRNAPDTRDKEFTLGDFLLYHSPNTALRKKINGKEKLWREGVREYALSNSNAEKVKASPISPEAWLYQGDFVDKLFVRCFSEAEALSLVQRDMDISKPRPERYKNILRSSGKLQKHKSLASLFMKNGFSPETPEFWATPPDNLSLRGVPLDVFRDVWRKYAYIAHDKEPFVSTWAEHMRRSLKSSEGKNFWNSIAENMTKRKKEGEKVPGEYLNNTFFFLLPPLVSKGGLFRSRATAETEPALLSSGHLSPVGLKGSGTNFLASIDVPGDMAFLITHKADKEGGAVEYLWEDMANAGIFPEGSVLKETWGDRPLFLVLTEKIGQKLWMEENEENGGPYFHDGTTPTQFILTREWSDAAVSKEVLSWVEERLSVKETEPEGEQAVRLLCRSLLLTPEAPPFIEKLASKVSQYPKTAALITETMWNFTDKKNKSREKNQGSDIIAKLEQTALSENTVYLKEFLTKYQKGKNPAQEALLSLTLKMKELEDRVKNTAGQGLSLEVF